MEDLTRFSATIHAQGRRALSGSPSLAGIAEAMREIVGSAESRLRAEPPAGTNAVACAAGCSTCCILNVSILFPEAIAIAEHVRRQWGEGEVAQLTSRLHTLYLNIVGVDDEGRIVQRRSCAFLDDSGCCSIYPVRPLLCRALNSTDPEACRQAVVAATFGETRPILMNLRQKEIMETAFRSLGGALEEFGLDHRGTRLTVAMRALLADPDLPHRWLAGAPVPAD